MTDSPKPLLYHESVDALRRELMATHLAMYATSQTYMEAALDGREVTRRDAVTDAWHAATTGWNFSYVLAAVLGVAAKEFGDDVAHRLACVADNLIANGDDDPGHNADVTPEREASR